MSVAIITHKASARSSAAPAGGRISVNFEIADLDPAVRSGTDDGQSRFCGYLTWRGRPDTSSILATLPTGCNTLDHEALASAAAELEAPLEEGTITYVYRPITDAQEEVIAPFLVQCAETACDTFGKLHRSTEADGSCALHVTADVSTASYTARLERFENEPEWNLLLNLTDCTLTADESAHFALDVEELAAQARLLNATRGSVA